MSLAKPSWDLTQVIDFILSDRPNRRIVLVQGIQIEFLQVHKAMTSVLREWPLDSRVRSSASSSWSGTQSAGAWDDNFPRPSDRRIAPEGSASDDKNTNILQWLQGPPS